MDFSQEEFFTHNQVKRALHAPLSNLVRASEMGYFIPNGMLLSNPAADLSTEPDAAFATWETMRSDRLRLVEDVELEGTPDLVLEILTKASMHRVLRDLYWRAGVQEYWLVNALQAPLGFDILAYTAAGYVAVEPVDGWLASSVLGKSFQLTQQADPLGHPRFTLVVK